MISSQHSCFNHEEWQHNSLQVANSAHGLAADDQWISFASAYGSPPFRSYEIPGVRYKKRVATGQIDHSYLPHSGVNVYDQIPGHQIKIRDSMQDSWYLPDSEEYWQPSISTFAGNTRSTSALPNTTSNSTISSLHEYNPSDLQNNLFVPDKTTSRSIDYELLHGRSLWTPATSEQTQYMLSSVNKHISTELGEHSNFLEYANETVSATTNTHSSRTHKSTSSKTFWSTAEDEKLLAAVASVKETFDAPLPWALVADAVQGRTAVMCSKRFRQLSRQRSDDNSQSYTRGPWTSEEDADLLAVVAECKCMSRVPGLPLPWTKIGSMLKQPRSGLQVCARYTEALDETVKRGRWTKEEDTKLLEEYLRLAGRWSLICQAIEGRTQRQCASRYGVLMGKSRTRTKVNDKQTVQCV